MTAETGCTHDLFISYADADRAWVEGYLLDGLTQAGVRCHSEAAFALGVPCLLEFERAVRESRRTLLVLSPAYLAEGFTQFTDLLAQSYGLETATWPVIPFVLDPVDLPPRLAMLTALDATDATRWSAVVERLCGELQRPVPGPAPRPPCPYPGMVPFSEADSARFFGRDEEVRELLERLRLHPFVTVIGPSGSGKSSLVFAGLVPALRESGLFGSGDWLVRALRPGEAPLAALSAALDGTPADLRASLRTSDVRSADLRASLRTTNKRLLLVADQFEELFTLARSDVEPFQQALLRLAETPNCYVVLTVRADFYPDLMACPLWPEIQAHRFEVLPLDEDGLRQAIVRPAEDAGVFVESALVERLVADAGREPGVLPLVQETLVLLWERVERRFLPLRAYEALVLPRGAYGAPERTGLQVAMARRADAALAGLTPEQQAIARRIFLRLVQFGEGRADTRRQQPVRALRVAGEGAGVFDRTLEHLADHRMLTLSGGEGGVGRRVDIAHESLIAGWPALQEWLSERRGAEQTRRRLEGKAAEWVRLGRGAGGLLDEVELLEAERWLDSPDAAELGTGEALPALVDASRDAQEEAAEQQRRATRFRLGALGAIAALVIVALVIGLWSARRNAANLEAIADRESQLAQQQQDAAATAQAYAIEQRQLAEAEATARAEAVAAQETAETERDRADRQAQIALARQLAAQAEQAREQGIRLLPRSVLLAAESLRSAPTLEGDQALRRGLALLPVTQVKDGAEARGAAFSPDGRWVASGDSVGTARVWEARTGREVARVEHEHEIWGVAFSPDGRLVASLGCVRYGPPEGDMRVWEAATGQEIFRVPHWDRGAVAFSPDGRWVVSRDEDGAARVWEATTGQQVPWLEDEDLRYPLVFSPDGRWAASMGGSDIVRVWDVATGEAVARLEHEGVADFDFSPKGWWLVSVGWDDERWQDTVRVWDTRSWEEDTRMEQNDVVAVVFSPDGRQMALGGDGTDSPGEIQVWGRYMAWGRVARIELEAEVRAVTFSPDGRWVASGSMDGTVQVWDAATGEEVGRLTHEDEVRSVAFSPDGQWLASASSDGTARVWDAPPGGQVVRHAGGGAMALSPDGKRIVSAGGEDVVQVWEASTGDAMAQMVQYGALLDVAFSPDGQWVASASGVVPDGPGEVRVWEAATGGEVARMAHELPVWAVDFSPDGQRLASASGAWRGFSGEVRVWDISAALTTGAGVGEEVARMVHDAAVWAVAFSPDGQWLASGGDNTARVWETATGEEIARMEHRETVVAVDFSPDGRWVASGSREWLGVRGDRGEVRVWEAATGQEVARMDHEDADVGDSDRASAYASGVYVVAFSPDGRWVASGSGSTEGGSGKAQVWEAATGREVARMDVEHSVRALAFSPDGRWLASGSADNTVRVWEAATGEEVARMAHEDEVGLVAFSPDGQWLASGGWDGTTRVWLWRPEDLIAQACGRLTRNLTLEEWGMYFRDQPYRCTCPDLPPGEDTPLDACPEENQP